MTYIALARKWRPRTFSQLIGQEHINRVLINSIDQNRLHHAYLFTGTRGVGKTSVARILAKALNCEGGIRSEPCLQCEACLSIEQGRFIDLIEIDGASRTRVEDTRELLENVQYAPTSGRFKIYIIDEVHMLSQHSFNALLKTLEEPPAHVKFFLATTDPHKLPITVLSRCLQFNLKHVQPDLICQHLATILDEEKLPYETQALEILATAACGSVRDALSLLDQAIASSDKKLLTRDIKNILGYTQQDYAAQLIQGLADMCPSKLLSLSAQIAVEGGHYHYVIDEILNYLHQMSISLLLPDNNPFTGAKPEVHAMATHFTPEDLQLFYQIGLKSTEDLHLAPTLRIGFEMMLLRMYTFKPMLRGLIPPLLYQTPDVSLITIPSVQYTDSSVNEITTIDNAPIPNVSFSAPELPKPITPPQQHEVADWNTILPQLRLSGLALNAAENAEFISKSDAIIVLRIQKGHRSVFTAAVIGRIEQGLTSYYKEVIKLTLTSEEEVLSSPAQNRKKTQTKEHNDALIALQNDSFFQQMQQEFSAELVKNSITPLKDDL